MLIPYRNASFGFVVILAATQVGSSSSLAESPAEIVAEYRDAVSRLATSRYDALVNSYEKGGVFDRETWLKAHELTTVSIGDAWRQKFRDRSCFEIGDRLSLHALDIERVKEGGGRLVESVLTYSPTERFSKEDAFTADLGEPTRQVVTVDLDISEELRDRIERVVQPIYGYLPVDGGHGIVEIMMESSNLTHEGVVEVDGHRTQVIQSIGDFGIHRLFIDTDDGFLARRIECVKRKSDRYYSGNRRVEDFNVNPREGSRFPKSPLVGAEYVVGNVVISKVGGLAAVTAFENVATSTYTNGETFTHRSTVQLKNIDWSPSEDELALTTKIPAGSRVVIKGAKGVYAEWRDGKRSQ